MAVSHQMERVRMANAGDPEDLELDPPVPGDDEPEDLQDNALVEDEADEESEQDQVDTSDQQPEERQPTERQPSRGESRHQRLANELRQRDERIAELNRRLDAVLAGQQSRQPQDESPEVRAQRLALLTPEERITSELNDAKQNFSREIAQMRFVSQDGNDRAAFQAKATVDPLYKKWGDKVEAELITLRNQGLNIERERLMYYLIGKAAVEGRQANGGRQRVQAQERVRRQQTRPSNSGSDVAPSRARGTSLERRLENVEL